MSVSWMLNPPLNLGEELGLKDSTSLQGLRYLAPEEEATPGQVN